MRTFILGETTKPQFDKEARAILGEQVSMHNELLLAILSIGGERRRHIPPVKSAAAPPQRPVKLRCWQAPYDRDVQRRKTRQRVPSADDKRLDLALQMAASRDTRGDSLPTPSQIQAVTYIHLTRAGLRNVMPSALKVIEQGMEIYLKNLLSSTMGFAGQGLGARSLLGSVGTPTPLGCSDVALACHLRSELLGSHRDISLQKIVANCTE